MLNCVWPARGRERGAGSCGVAMETLERDRDGRPDRQLYALLHLSPEASDDDVKRAYRQWAQVYHPDKHQTPQVLCVPPRSFLRSWSSCPRLRHCRILRN